VDALTEQWDEGRYIKRGLLGDNVFNEAIQQLGTILHTWVWVVGKLGEVSTPVVPVVRITTLLSASKIRLKKTRTSSRATLLTLYSASHA
jgi:hypothetical protein